MDLLNLFYKSFNTLKSIDTLKQKLIIIAWVLPLLIKNKNKYYINFLLKRIFL
jgi:ribosomal protein L30E